MSEKLEEKVAAPEVPVQEQLKVKVKVTNINELNELILKANKTIDEINRFKFKIASDK